jgi:DNA polymerase III sliding clamp (beta) subunit (PCNA family)
LEIKVQKLRELMELMKPSMPKKVVIKATAFIRLGEGKAIATNLETMISVDMPEAKEPLLIPFTGLVDSLKYIAGNQTMTIEATEKKLVQLSWPDGHASYPTEDVVEFPVLPEINVKAEADLNADMVIPGMLEILPYASTDEARPILNGITMVLGNPVELAAGDGFRMGHKVLPISFPIEEKIIIPQHAVIVLGHAFNKMPRVATLPIAAAKRPLHLTLYGDDAVPATKATFNFGKVSVVVNLIQGNPPNFLALIPKDEAVWSAQMFAPQMEAAIKRVRTIAKGGSSIVRLSFENGMVSVMAVGEDQEISTELKTIAAKGEPWKTALNYGYLVTYLSGKQGIITMSQHTDKGPLVFQYQNSPRVLIMPMAVGEDKPKKDEPEPETGETTEPAAETPTEPANAETEEEEEEEEEDEGGEAAEPTLKQAIVEQSGIPEDNLIVASVKEDAAEAKPKTRAPRKKTPKPVTT